MIKEMNKISSLTERNAADPAEGNLPSNLQEFSFLCQDDHWLSDFIQDTENHQMLTAPSRLMPDTLAKLQKIQLSKRIQLITYSLRVSLAAAGAILILFTTPILLEHSPFGMNAMGQTAGWERTAIHQYQPKAAQAARQLKSRLYDFSDSIYQFSNELFTGRNQHD
ncbi:MAG: hypothetical protein Q4F76_02010 [Lachnospiraceae bacterium]|nr:hypothetical protein [Lachnospiraceae bacterium]